MSRRELERVEVMGRVGSGDLLLQDAAAMLGLSYRQTKRVWRRYRERRAKGLKHGNAGRESNRSKPGRLRRRVLKLVRKKYSGQRASASGRRWRPSTWRKKMPLGSIMRPCGAGCWQRGCGADAGSGSSIVSDGKNPNEVHGQARSPLALGL